jgi:hypothetical protein
MMQLESHSADGDSYGEPYRLGKRLRSGSTGDVFQTRHPHFPDPCAMKILRPELVEAAADLQAFRDDLEVLTGVRHPNIVHVLEVGVLPNGVAFVVTELLEGRSLTERLAGGEPLPAAEVVEVVRATAAGLQAAHSRGVVHGEINPHNIFLARTEGYEQGLVKLVNFGISKLRPVDAPAALTLEAIRYLSPEQAAGRADEMDGRSDQFALAAVAYRMLTGLDVFREDSSSVSLLCQLVHEGPTLALIEDPQLAAVLRRALAREKRERFESVVAFARAFEAALVGEISGRTPLPTAAASSPPARPTAAAPTPEPTPPFEGTPTPVRPVPVPAAARRLQEKAATLLGFAGSDLAMLGAAAFAAEATVPRRVEVSPLPAVEPPAPGMVPRPGPTKLERAVPRVPEPPIVAMAGPPISVVAASQAPARVERSAFVERPMPAPHRAREPAPRRPPPRGPHRPAPQAPPRPAPRAQAAPVDVSTDSLFSNPFFTDSVDMPRSTRPGRRMSDSLLDDDLRLERPPRQGWKLFFFLVAFLIACFGASMAAGWRPPLSLRQTMLWHHLHLPYAADPLPPAPVD